MQFSLDPAFMIVNYHSAQAPHAMTLPTKEWFPTDITGALGSFGTWDLGTIDAEVMVNALVDALCPFLLPTTHFDAATIYTQAAADGPAIPQKSVGLLQVGSSASTGIAPAISTTFNFKTLGNSNSKLVLLDAPLGAGGFTPLFPAGFSADVDLLAAEWESPANAWAGRDNTRPNVLRTITFDLNDKLQKKYYKT
jgi:hypothetical protein